MESHILAAKQPRLSLLWKLLIPCGFIFAVISALMAWQSWNLVTRELHNKTQEQLAGDERVLRSLFTQLHNELSHIGIELANAFGDGGDAAFNLYIDNSPDLFARLNWALVFAGEAERAASWSPAGLQVRAADSLMSRLLTETRQTFRPVGQIYCAADCEYVIAIPGGAPDLGVTVMLAVPLAEVMPTYGTLTAGDIALLKGRLAAPEMLAQSLQGEVADPALFALLRPEMAVAGESALGKGYFSYRTLDLDSTGSGAPLRAVLLRDLSGPRAQAQKLSINQLLVDMTVIVLGFMALFAIMSRNLNRLQRITKVLPRLSEAKDYSETREALRQASPPRRASDEVDALRDTLEWLSERLEKLHGAEAASDAKSRFLATMSHEIRTPMSGILGLTELLARSNLNHDQRRMAKMVHESTANLMTIINDVLDYSRIEAGAAELDLQEFSPIELLESVADLIAANASNKNLKLKLLVDPKVPRCILGDQGKLRQVLLNLASNAVKFTEAGSVTLLLQVGDADEHGTKLTFAVKDTGIGIPESAQSKVFQRFSQADSTTTRRFGGTGLGLAICEGLMRLMGGSIRLSSVEGLGSCFSCDLSFPVVEAAGAPSQILQNCSVRLSLEQDEADCWAAHLQRAGASVGSSPEAGSSWRIDIKDDASGDRGRLSVSWQKAGELGTYAIHRPLLPQELIDLIVAGGRVDDREATDKSGRSYRYFGARVLVAEDQPVNRELLGRQLQQLGCEAVLAADGRLALDALEVPGAEFDLLITDLHMPEMDGYALTRAIRQHHNQAVRKMPVVVLTASASPQDLARLQQQGVNLKLVKPVRIEELERCFDELKIGTQPFDQASADDVSTSEHVDDGDLILDMGLLRDVLGDDLSILGSYRTMFEDTTRPLLAQCREALDREDLEELASLAHRIKGSGRSLGGVRLANAIRGLEDDIEAGGKNLTALLKRVEEEFDSLVLALDEMVRVA